MCTAGVATGDCLHTSVWKVDRGPGNPGTPPVCAVSLVCAAHECKNPIVAVILCCARRKMPAAKLFSPAAIMFLANRPDLREGRPKGQVSPHITARVGCKDLSV